MAGLVRLGLIGVGRWGRNIVRTCATLGDTLSLCAVASTNPQTRQEVPAECAVFGEWREMLTGCALDGVIIATPPQSHAEIAQAAIAAGLSVLVEKPLTTDPAQARQIAAAARAAGVPVMVDHIHLYNPAFRRLLKLAPSMGPIRAIQGLAGNRGPYRSETSVLWDWGPHDVAMMLKLAGGVAPSQVSARRLERKRVDGGIGEVIELRLDFACGIQAISRLGTLMDKCRSMNVACETGTLLYDDMAEAKLVALAPDGSPQVVPVAGPSPLAVILGEFANVAARRAAADDGLDLAIMVVDVLAKAAEALESP